jgi:hypothetical protein
VILTRRVLTSLSGLGFSAVNRKRSFDRMNRIYTMKTDGNFILFILYILSYIDHLRNRGIG